MPITALALLRIAKPATALRTDELTDSVIVHTDTDFSVEPEELAGRLREQLGEDVLAHHDDPRGILFIPSVAKPSARSYEEVIAEVGEGGVWAPLAAGAAGWVQSSGFGDLLGGMLAQLPPSLLASAQAAALGDAHAMNAVGAQVQALMSASPELAGLAQQLTESVGQRVAEAPPPGEELAALEQMFAGFGGGEAAQSSLREMVLGMQAELMNDPDKFQQLARQLFQADPTKK
jgi:hypothetical protein